MVVPFGLLLGWWCHLLYGGSVAPLYGQSAAVYEVVKVGIDWYLGLGVRFGGQLALDFAENIRGAAARWLPLHYLCIWQCGGEAGPSDGPYGRGD